MTSCENRDVITMLACDTNILNQPLREILYYTTLRFCPTHNHTALVHTSATLHTRAERPIGGHAWAPNS